MPESIAQQEIKSIKYRFGGDDSNPACIEAIENFLRKCTFDNIPPSSRVVTFCINRTSESNFKYLNLCRRVEKSREYLNWYSEMMFYFENPSLLNKKLLAFDFKEEIEVTISVNYSTSAENERAIIEKEISDLFSETKQEETKEDDVKTEDQKILDEYKKVDGLDSNLILKIKSIKSSSEIPEFYMSNCDWIDDTPYEVIFNTKREELEKIDEGAKISKKVEQPKKPSSPVSKSTSQSSIPVQPSKTEYTGNEKYTISDGFKDISGQLTFQEAKDLCIVHLKQQFNHWNNPNLHRDGITTFYNANKVLIDRDVTFKEEITQMSKIEFERLKDEKRKELINKANGL